MFFASPLRLNPGWLILLGISAFQAAVFGSTTSRADGSKELLSRFCLDCHDGETAEGKLDLESPLDELKLEIAFENVIAGRMPPADADQPSDIERKKILRWFADQTGPGKLPDQRRLSRHEFVQTVNDLLNIRYDLTESIPDDRGTFEFDTDRRINLSSEMLSAYMQAADTMLEYAFPPKGFLPETTWTTQKIRDSHQTYNIYTRSTPEGILFSWTRANNGNGYSFFYDGFEPSVSGWYEMTFDASKIGNFPGDASLMVYAGKYYFADDRPQPQRLLDVISIGDNAQRAYTIRGFLHPGENVSVHCFSQHTWRLRNPDQGILIRKLTIRGPLTNQWPPRSYLALYPADSLQVPPRKSVVIDHTRSCLEKIGGSIQVSSFQKGMEKEKMLDGSNRTFWHTKFSPELAKPPHYVVIRNPKKARIRGLVYSTWSGGNGNGQVTGFAIQVSDNGKSWSDSIATGSLERQVAAEQPILFPEPVQNEFIRFLITESYSIDGRSLASIGRLDVMADVDQRVDRTRITFRPDSRQEWNTTIRRFAERAFCKRLSDQEIRPFVSVAQKTLEETGDEMLAVQHAVKAVLCSPRFLYHPGFHQNDSERTAVQLARSLWLSVPDKSLRELAFRNRLKGNETRKQIRRMLADPRAERMIHSFSEQWLNLRSFKTVPPSLKLYPLYDDLLDFYLPLETEAYLLYLIRNNLPVKHLIDSDFTFLNQRLARHYGVNGVRGQQLRKESLPADSPRGGLLTMGSILKVTTDGFDTSPIRRGAWVSKNFVGNVYSPPPENIKPIQSDTSGAHTIRERIEQHKQHESCAACHRQIDPYGFALESFDATGQWRSRYREMLPHQGTFQYRRQGYFRPADAVDPSGEIAEQQFDDIKAFKRILLANQRKIAYNFMKKFFTYVNGHAPSLAQRLKLHGKVPANPATIGMRDLVETVLLMSTGADE